jgi:protease-4
VRELRRNERVQLISAPASEVAMRTRLAAIALALAAASLANTGCITVNAFGGGREPLVEAVVQGERGPKILLVEIDSTIKEDEEDSALGLPLREGSVARIREQLDLARKSEVRALVLRIDSPGGTVTASDLLYREILRFKEERSVPVIAQFMGIAASGGYYAAMAADRLIAQPTTITGSIGVIFSGLNLAGLFEKLGVEDQTLTAGDRKDSGSPFRPMRPEERAQLQTILDGLHARFLEVVAKGRPGLPPQRIAELADGRIYTAAQALENGLVDEIGYLPDAIRAAERAAGLESSVVVAYHRPHEWRKNVYYTRAPWPQLAPELTPQLEIARALGLWNRPAFLYLWMPGAR